LKRRNFIKTGLYTSSGILFIDSILGCVNSVVKQENLEKYFKGFQNPPVDSRLFVRWWWNGNRLTEKEILRELDVMDEAGIGGVEINPIAFPQDASPMGYEALTMFDDKWLEMLQAALHGAKERGMVCDMIVGSGWPFGGEFLKKEDQSQMVTIETIDLEGEKQYRFNINELLKKVEPEIHSKNEKVFKELILARLAPKSSDKFVEGEDITGNVANGLISVDVPKGKYVLYCVVKLTGYMAVINGALGAAGPVLNHYSKSAVENYLNRISGFITGKIGNMGNYIRAMFCDSMELEGANWNDDFPGEFEKRRGYSILPYLPYVLKKVGHMGNPVEEEYGTIFSANVTTLLKHIELDFYTTRIELFKERFIDTFNNWCHRNSVKSRIQAYGRGMHPLEAGMTVDIPECETWLFNDVGREMPELGLEGRGPRMVNKYVASGAALAGKKIVSCEEITNVSMPFMATLENIKVAGDQSNLSGVTHSILHGFNYSPPDIPFPGWVRYGAYFNEKNTWWPYFRLWADYKARLSYLLQNATPQANIAILQPLTDLWLKHGPQRDPFPQKWYPEYQNNLWEVIHQNGGGCDYVSENIINNSSFVKGELVYNNCHYSTLLLPEVETIEVETARSLEAFASNGGKIIFIGKKPYQASGYVKKDKNDKVVQEITDNLLNKENAVIYPAPGKNIIDWFGHLQEQMDIQPFVRFHKPNKYLSQASYLLEKFPLFFIANTSLSENITVNCEFQADRKLYPWLWNPETGERVPCPTHGANNLVNLNLPGATSVLILFEAEKTEQPSEINASGKSESVLEGSWNLILEHINGERVQTSIRELSDLTGNTLSRNFAGVATYEKEFEIDSEDYSCIDLGEVQGISELLLNDQLIGTKWYGAHRYDIRGRIIKGKNKVTIKLTTITGNYLKGLKDNKVARRWTAGQNYYPMGVMGPVKLL
jgi:hypothetical protein